LSALSICAALAEERPGICGPNKGSDVAVATDMDAVYRRSNAGQCRRSSGFDEGFYRRVRIIYRRCTDPMSVPEQVTRALKCSRAVLYQRFAGGAQQSVAARNLVARIEHAAGHAHHRVSDLLIGEIAFRRGFVRSSTFNSMFKRRYGMSPQEDRAGG